MVMIVGKACKEQLSDENIIILDDLSKKWLNKKYRPESIKSYIHYGKQLLLFLQKQKLTACELTTDILSDYLLQTATAFPKSRSNVLFGLKPLVRFLTSEKIINDNVQKVLNVKVVVHRPLYIGFSEAESQALLSAADRTTQIGKRDYAMMLLAKRTGMRSMDIRSLRLGDIDWRNSEIRIIQSKSQTALTLPLSDDLGDAISDYILNGRPQTIANEVFVSSLSPFLKLEHKGGTTIAKYVKIANLNLPKNVRIGFHSFRRALGVSLLQAEIPREMISQIFGHNSPNSTKAYLAIDFTHLKDCAMPMNEYLF